MRDWVRSPPQRGDPPDGRGAGGVGRCMAAMPCVRCVLRWARVERPPRGRWEESVMQSYDLAILGGGPAAFTAAGIAQERGARTLIIEERQPGGVCPNRGCMPSKRLISEARRYAHARRHAARFGGHDPAPPPMQRLVEEKDDLVRRSRAAHVRSVERSGRIELLSGRGRLVGRGRIAIGSQEIDATRILIATGASPLIPAISGLAETPHLTSEMLGTEEGLSLRALPRSLVFIGGGYIACELGQSLRRLGAEVAIVEIADRLLPDQDARIGAALGEAFEEGEGIALHLRSRVTHVSGDAGEVRVSIEGSEATREITAERLVVTAGVTPNSRDLGLAEAGVDTDEAGFIRVDARMRTTAQGIWAAGDVVGPPMATPVANYRAAIAAGDIFDDPPRPPVAEIAVPRAVFTDPEIGAVGWTAEAARAAGLDVQVGEADLARTARGAVEHKPRGLARLVAEAGTLRLLGAQLCCPRAAEIVQLAAAAVASQWTVANLQQHVYVYPTFTEILRDAAGRVGKD
ncbi:MAG: mercury(II) reductase [Candidatus Eisenbacteria bacterium]|nr:mercury(II) reductase [Candidatus Eisenbacteria bacterium]